MNTGRTYWRRFELASMVSVFVWAAISLAAEEPRDVRRDASVEAIEKVLPCVVNIATAAPVRTNPYYELMRQFYGWPAQPREQLYSVGSGVIVDENGYILSNLHVVQGASLIQVKLWDGRVYDAQPLVATPGSDVALLKINPNAGEKFEAIKLAKDDDLLLGETVIALGNPYGLGGSVARGILSSKNRRPSSGDEPLRWEDWLQTDAAINPGNSGGPLINLRGELIGINVAVYREQAGMGVSFAIPVKHVSRSLSEFFTPEVTDSLWFGAKFKAGVTPLIVSEVQPNSPAWRAGIRPGQTIREVNNKPVSQLVECAALIATSRDNLAQVTVLDDDKTRQLRVKMIPFETLIRDRLGLHLASLTTETARNLGVSSDLGLYVDDVERDSPADRAGMQKGQILLDLNGRSTTDLIAVANVVTTAENGDSLRATLASARRTPMGYFWQRGTTQLKLRFTP